MPDLDTPLTHALETIAQDARTRSRAVPASQVRRAATRRSRRRRAVLAATTVVALVAGFGALTGDPFGGNHRVNTTGAISATQPGSGSGLVTEKEVAESLGTMWAWRAGPIDSDPGKLTPCQDTPAADPSRTSAVSRVVTGGWSGDDTVTELVEHSPSSTAARAAFARAVDWFTRCGGQGVDQSGVKDSLTQRVAAAGPIAADQVRVVVRMRKHLGPDQWTNTVAAVIRVGEQVAVLAWDNTIDDNPGAYDSGFVQLVKTAASRLSGESLPIVADAALLHDDDAAVSALVHDPQTATTVADRVPSGDVYCGGPLAKLGPTVVAGRQMSTFGRDTSDQRGAIDSTVLVFDTAAAAQEAVQTFRDESSTVCAGKTATPLEMVGDWPGWAVEASSTSTSTKSPVRHAYAGAVRAGRAVAYVDVTELQGPVDDAHARAVFERAAQRLAAAYG